MQAAPQWGRVSQPLRRKNVISLLVTFMRRLKFSKILVELRAVDRVPQRPCQIHHRRRELAEFPLDVAPNVEEALGVVDLRQAFPDSFLETLIPECHRRDAAKQ